MKYVVCQFDTTYLLCMLFYMNISMVLCRFSELKDRYYRIERFGVRFDVKKWFTGFIKIHNVTCCDLCISISTTANYKLISDINTNGKIKIHPAGISIGGGRHIIYDYSSKTEQPQRFIIPMGDKQSILLYEPVACMTILAPNPNSPGDFFEISGHSLVTKGYHYVIRQSDFDEASLEQ